MADVSAVVVTYHGGERLLRCLRSLRRQQPRPLEVLVVVANARDVCAELDLELGVPVQVVHIGQQLHYGLAANVGAEAARGAWLLILNDDTRLRSGFLQALSQAAERQGPGIYQPRILLADDSGRLDNAGHGLYPDGFNQPRGREQADGPEFDLPGAVAVVSGAAFLVQGAAFRALGGFDSGLQVYGEDVDLSLRALRRGLALRYVPEAKVEHELGASYGRHGLRKVFLVERNRVRAGLRSLPWALLASQPAWTAARWALQGSAALAGRGWGAQLPRGAALAAVAGTLVGWAYLPQALAKRWQDAAFWELGELRMLAHCWRERALLPVTAAAAADPNARPPERR